MCQLQRAQTSSRCGSGLTCLSTCVWLAFVVCDAVNSAACVSVCVCERERERVCVCVFIDVRGVYSASKFSP